MSKIPKKLTCREPATEAPIKFIYNGQDDVTAMAFVDHGINVVRNGRDFLIPWSNICFVEMEKADAEKTKKP